MLISRAFQAIMCNGWDHIYAVEINLRSTGTIPPVDGSLAMQLLTHNGNMIMDPKTVLFVTPSGTETFYVSSSDHM